MSAKKSDTAVAEAPASRGGLLGLLRGNARWLLFVGVFVAVCAVGWKMLWESVREQVISAVDNRIDPEQIEITPLPAWIHTDLKAEVMRDASLDGPLSLLDPELTVHVARAFALHPWVAKVERVSKQAPAGVAVELIYRRPVAMVEVPGPALLPVDADGVLLPTADFSPTEALHYLRIAEITTSPLGPVGTRWSDTHVAGAARIAAVLLEDWETLKLYQIVSAARQVDASGVESDTYELYTRERTRVDWGRPPGAETGTEAKAAQKVERLRNYAAQHGGSLEDPTGPQRLDVRSASSLTVAPRPPVQTLPEANLTPQQRPGVLK
ncbi:MAG TPA: hypothetical protein VHY91_24770 [Pirellulales bacterium]|jgi:hypothetical protein|nr:hypothetical protein [Pirellulales bacterium]